MSADNLPQFEVRFGPESNATLVRCGGGKMDPIREELMITHILNKMNEDGALLGVYMTDQNRRWIERKLSDAIRSLQLSGRLFFDSVKREWVYAQENFNSGLPGSWYHIPDYLKHMGGAS